MASMGGAEHPCIYQSVRPAHTPPPRVRSGAQAWITVALQIAQIDESAPMMLKVEQSNDSSREHCCVCPALKEQAVCRGLGLGEGNLQFSLASSLWALR